MKLLNILTTEPTKDYELLDCGEGEKLERFGNFVLSRPDPQAIWHKKLPISIWKKADGSFNREENHAEWSIKDTIKDRWIIELGCLKFYIKPTNFKHVGIFPEQNVNWDWMRNIISKNDNVEVLNLFGYTGGASLACAQAGAKVVHIDGSKSAIAWARENAELSNLSDKPIRWILEDARTFVSREIKRERKYDGIIMDPPAFGHGPENELWKIEDHLLPLIDDCMKILKEKPLFFIINGYSAGYSSIAYENILLPLIKKYGGDIEIGELVIKESNTESDPNEEKPRNLPCGIYARWQSK